MRFALSAKAKSPRDVTEAGIETEVIFLFRNAEAPMDFIPGGMNKSLLMTVPDGSFRVVIMESCATFSISLPPGFLKVTEAGKVLLLV